MKGEINHFYDEYRNPTSVTACSTSSLPRIHDAIDFAWDDQLSSGLDAKRDYYQMKVEESDESKAVLSLHHGLYQITFTRYSLKNDPTTLKRVRDNTSFFVKLKRPQIHRKTNSSIVQTRRQKKEANCSHVFEKKPAWLKKSKRLETLLKKKSFICLNL